MSDQYRKLLGGKAYGHIGHLPGSKLGPGDHRVPDGQAAIVTVKKRDRWDCVVVQEKVDGTCVAVAKHEGRCVPLMRAGHLCSRSNFAQHHEFDSWAMRRAGIFDALLSEGERVVGEWMYQAHSIRYRVARPQDLFVAFDIMRGKERLPSAEVYRRCDEAGITRAHEIHRGDALDTGDAYHSAVAAGHPRLDAIDPREGLVYRCERTDHRTGKVETSFLAKWVRADFEAGRYLDGQTILNAVGEEAA